MGAINTACAEVTALLKCYSKDDTQFLTAASTATEYPDEFYAATINKTTTTNQTIVRFIQNSASTWTSYEMLDAAGSAIVSITGTTSSNFARLGDYVVYSNYDDDVKIIKTRTSSGDTQNNYVHKAGLPDPDATTIIDRMDETTPWSVSTGIGTIAKDTAPVHRTQGTGCLKFSNNTADSSYFQRFFSTTLDLTSFTDGTTSTDSDYIALEVFRFNKDRVKNLTILLFSDTAFSSYFEVSLVATPTITDQDGEEWNNYHPQQSTFTSEWKIDPYDNKMFNVRVRKGYFAQTSTPDWGSIKAIRICLISDDVTSATNESAVSIDNMRLLRTPPIATNFRIQIATFEHSESGSTDGWEKVEGSTPSSFNHDMPREGYASLVVTRCAAIDGTPTATLNFDSPKNFMVYPDGSTASTGDVLKVNVWWKGLSAGISWDVDYADFAPPYINFIDSDGFYSRVKCWCFASMLGGGDTKQMRFDTSGALWTTGPAANEADFTKISKISICGPYHCSQTTQAYIFDDLRLERPNAIQPVNIFEPVELIALDAFGDFADSHMKDFAWVAELVAEGLKWLFKAMKYQTYGMGCAIYPDYEHSSIGIAGLTLMAWGSKTFGMLLKNPSKRLDLSKFQIPQPLWPPEWDPDNSKYLFFQMVEIPAGQGDKFSIWLASEDIKAVREVKIKIHPGIGAVGAADETEVSRENFWEYSISGTQLAAKMVEDWWENKQVKEYMEAVDDAIDDGRGSGGDVLTHLYTNNQAGNPKSLRQFVTAGIRMLGKDRGGWPSAVFEWKKKDMMLQKGKETENYLWNNIRGIAIEVTGTGGNGTICVDNFMMYKEGALKGDFHYKVVLEDERGFASPSSEPSRRVTVDKKDVVLNNIYVPSTNDQSRIKNKKIYRIGGSSTEWRDVGSLSVTNDKFYDNMYEEDAGRVMPTDKYGPPRSKIVKQIGNAMYYGNVMDRVGDKRPYTVYRSEAFCPFRVDDFMAVNIPETKGSGITGIEEYYNYICLWTPDSFYTVDPSFKSVPVKRSNRGSVAPKAVVNSEYGLIWLSPVGLMLGTISKVDEKFFEPINSLFDSYSEEDLKDAIGFVVDKYYYLFYADKKGVCCYLPDRLFSELESDAFYVKSVSVWDGRNDNNAIYYGRDNGTIYKMFDGSTDDGTAISTELTSKDYSEPGIMYDKYVKALYVATARMEGSTCATLSPKINVGQSSIETLDTISAETTSIKTYVAKASQGDYGTHVGFSLIGNHRHKIVEMALKVETEEDAEYTP